MTQITGCREGAGGEDCDPELCRNSAVIEIKIWQSLWGQGARRSGRYLFHRVTV